MIDIQKPGTAILVYTDEGPRRPCGQSVSVTCPKTAVHVFESEEAMRHYMDANADWGQSSKRPRFDYMVVEEGQMGGMSLHVHQEVQPCEV